MLKRKKFSRVIKAEDGFRISFAHYRTGHDSVVILAHGFYNNKDTYFFNEMAEKFALEHDVISLDFRGHGKSEGLFSWTSQETKDLRAIISYAKKIQYNKIRIIGFSLGAAIAIIEGSQNRDIDGIIAVSSPYDFWKIDYRFWEEEMLEDLKLNIGPKGKGKGIRPGNPFMKKIRPIDVVDKISPTPIHFIHGKKDWLIAPEHSQKLFEKANEPKKLSLIDNAGHAERIYNVFPDDFILKCCGWIKVLN